MLNEAGKCWRGSDTSACSSLIQKRHYKIIKLKCFIRGEGRRGRSRSGAAANKASSPALQTERDPNSQQI